MCKELIHLGCYPAKHCQKIGVCSAVLSTYQTETKTTTKAVCQTQTLRRQSMQPQPQIPGQNKPPNVGAGMGQSHQTLQPKQELPPYQQSVMPQKAVISRPPPRAVKEAQKIAQATTMQAVGSGVPMGRSVPHPQQGFPKQEPPNMAPPSGLVAPPMMRQH